MHRNYYYLLLCFTVFVVHPAISKPAGTTDSNRDSLGSGKLSGADCFIATSLFINSNWKGKHDLTILFYASFNLSDQKNYGNIKTISELRAELGYRKIQDSSWYKTADKFFLSYIRVIKNENGFRHSFSANLKTQFTNSWDNNPYEADSKRTWNSGPMLPAITTIGYGTNFSFKENSYLNISIASLKIKSTPRKDENLEIKSIAKTDKYLLNYDYGISIQWVLRNKFSGYFTWENKFNLFTKTLKKDGTTFDMQNSFAFIPFDHFKINLVNKIAYDILISEKIQFRYELLLGYSFGKK